MENIKTLILILMPMFVGFAVAIPKKYNVMIDRLLNVSVYMILLTIGMGLARVDNLWIQLRDVMMYVLVLFTLLMTLNIVFLHIFEYLVPHHSVVLPEQKQKKINFLDNLKQPALVLVGLFLGKMLPEHYLFPEQTGTYILMVLIFLVGIQLRSNGISLKQVLLNKRGMQISAVFTLSCLLAGVLFAVIFDNVSLTKGLALSSGYGWYSLSGIVMTQAYDATWGSVALLNDLLREFFALMFIPLLMRTSSATAIGIGGATSLDFSLPIIQSSGGLMTVPLAISFGFVVNITSPFLMLIFSSF